MTTFIAHELEKLAEAIRDPQNASARKELYAAQQALAWASEPCGFKAPFAMIMGIPAGSEDCSVAHHPIPSSGTYCQTG